MGGSKPKWAFLALSVLAICVATLRPAGDTIPSGWSFSLVEGDEAVAELIQNLLLFVPFGFALALRSTLGARRLLLAGLALSFTVEFLQQWIPGRDPSLGDIIVNGAGALVGGSLVWTAPRWLNPPPRRAPWLALGSAAVAAGAWLGTGWLLQPDLPPTPPAYTSNWTPDIRLWGRYRGHVLSATLGALPLVEQAPVDEAALRAFLSGNERLQIALEAGRAPGRISPVVMIDAAGGRDVLVVAADYADVVLRYRTRAAALTLDRPDLRARGALAGILPGDTITARAWSDARAFCLSVGMRRWCRLGYTIGDGWKLVFFPEHFPPWALRLLNAMWVGGGLLGIGLCGGLRRHPASGAALLLAAVTLALGPRVVGLNATPLSEWLGGVTGLTLGWLAWRARTRLSFLRAPPPR